MPTSQFECLRQKKPPQPPSAPGLSWSILVTSGLLLFTELKVLAAGDDQLLFGLAFLAFEPQGDLLGSLRLLNDERYQVHTSRAGRTSKKNAGYTKPHIKYMRTQKPIIIHRLHKTRFDELLDITLRCLFIHKNKNKKRCKYRYWTLDYRLTTA